jgi:pentatricopeptide repeat protein
LLSVFLAHASADASAAQEIRTFIEAGCDGVRFAPDAAIQPGQDLFAAAESGLSEHVLVLLLSPASNPARWPLQSWEPFLHPPAADGAKIAIFLLQDCVFPGRLRRGLRLFDGTAERLTAMRQLKRWLHSIQLGTSASMTFSPDLEFLYRALADRPGTLAAPGAMAARFAQQAVYDFSAVCWIPAIGRTLTQIAGEIGAQLRMTLDGPPEDNCRRVRDMLSGRRCLLVLDAPQAALDPILPGGQTSILFTTEAVHIPIDEVSLAAGRALAAAGRLAEAYEVFQQLLKSGIEPQSCARELVWICERWDRLDEANALRSYFGPSPSEQLLLFS